METTPPFELEALQRDLIEGVEAGSLYQRVLGCIDRIREGGDAGFVRGVMIVERDPIAFSAAFFAAVYLRVPVILASRTWQRREWIQVMGLVNPAIIFGESPLSERERTDRPPDPEPSSILVPTGGSSAGVKLAIHTWETLRAACEGFFTFMGDGPIHSCCVLPLYHVSGLMQLVRSFLSQGLISIKSFKQLQLGDFPAIEPSALCLSLVPTQLQRLMTQRRVADQLLLLRAIFVGGAPMPGSVAMKARALKLPIIMCYGMTETAAMIAVLPPDEFFNLAENVARPMKQARVEIVNEDGDLCPAGASGLVRIQGPSLFKGYYGRPRLDLSQGLLTDDEGLIDAEGRLHILGRRDRIIISGGEKIDPQEVESAIMETGAVEQVLAIGWPDDEWGHKLVAFYVMSGVITDVGKWESELRVDLANYKIPKLIIQVPILPLDHKGKVDWKLMAQLISQSHAVTD